MFTRQCPDCISNIIYSSQKKLRRAEKSNKTCRSCSAKRMWRKPGSVHSTAETKKKISNSVKVLHTDPEYTFRATRAWIEAARSTKVSKLELSVRDQLLSFEFLHSNDRLEKFVGPYIPDYVNYRSKIILEIYGNYWHANPRIFSADCTLYDGLTAQQIWNRDNLRQAFYEQRSWRVIIIWEDEINLILERLNSIENQSDKS